MSLKLAYADPPYPGRAHLYEDHPDYAGEVDHEELIERLRGYDGWALSTNAESLHWILSLCPPEHRVLAWVKHTINVGWEPLIVVPARPRRSRDSGLRDWLSCEPDSYQYRPKPDSYVIGQKPAAFCRWLFAWLGADIDDELDDLFPGSGQVGRVWNEWRLQPTLPIEQPSPAAVRRAGKRAQDRMLRDQVTLEQAIEGAA